MKKLLLLLLISCVLPANAGDKSILVLGDSLSAGYGIPIKQGWVSLLAQRLIDQGYNYRIVNASISGDTSRGARGRLSALLDGFNPDIAIVELGGNDGLRGISIDEMSQNLTQIIDELVQRDSRVLLVPMQLPPNYGPVYNSRFQAVYRQLAGSFNITLGHFILDNIAGYPELMQSDGIHPKAEAQSIMLDNLWPDIERLVRQ